MLEAFIALEVVKKAMNYPLIKNYLQVEIVVEPYPHIPRTSLLSALDRLNIGDQFDEEFGVHTMIAEGPYPCDVEITLERLKRKGVI